MTAQPLALIAAVARNGVIGAQGDLPWHYPEDLAFYKRSTMGRALIMGRGTAESQGPLPGRRNIIVSRSLETPPTGFELADNLEAGIAMARTSDDEPFINGGGQIYAAALPLVTRMLLTEIPEEPDGTVHFPAVDWSHWELHWEERGSSGCVFREYRRR
ncbi:MAG: dihydrofolate reductase [Planctomycetota bacterium]